LVDFRLNEGGKFTVVKVGRNERVSRNRTILSIHPYIENEPGFLWWEFNKSRCRPMSNPSKKAKKEFALAYEKFKIAAVKLYGKNSIFDLNVMIDLWHEMAEDGTYDE
jgi:hypothetical protein